MPSVKETNGCLGFVRCLAGIPNFGHKTRERKTLKFFVPWTRSYGAFQVRKEPLYGSEQ